jgi:polar amino acid transport system substrate-binding protein
MDIELRIQTYPWSRAIKLAETNQVDGLLTAIQSEAPDLIYTKTPITNYQVCFFTSQSNPWTYKEIFSIGSNILGVIQDYGYGEPLDSYIDNNTNQQLQEISGLNGTERLLNMLLKGRVDIIAEDPKVLGAVAKQNVMDIQQVKMSGCFKSQPFYLALSPSEDNKSIIKKLDILLMKPENLEMLEVLFHQSISTNKKLP